MARQKTAEAIEETDLHHIAFRAAEGMDVESLIRSFNFHLKFTLAKDEYSATIQDRYQALALAVRDRLIGRWMATQQGLPSPKRQADQLLVAGIPYRKSDGE